MHTLNVIRSNIVYWSITVSVLSILEAALLAQSLRLMPSPVIEKTLESSIETLEPPTIAMAKTLTTTSESTAAFGESSSLPPANSPMISGARITLRGRPALHVSVDFSNNAFLPSPDQLEQITSSTQVESIYLVGPAETQPQRDQYRNRLSQVQFAPSHRIHLQKLTRDFSQRPGIVLILRQGAP